MRVFGVFFMFQLFTKTYSEKPRKRACTRPSCTIVQCTMGHPAQCVGHLGHSAPNGVQVKIWGARRILGEKFVFGNCVKLCKKSLIVPLSKNFQVEPVPGMAPTMMPSVLGTSGIMPPRDSK